MPLPPGVQIKPLNRLEGSWCWYYVDSNGHCRRVRNPILLVALAHGWRPKMRVPRAVVAP